MEKTEISNLKVSETTAKFVAALDLLAQTQEQFLDALSDLYGDDSGEQFFLESVQDFDAAKLHISSHLTRSVEDRLSCKTPRSII